MAEEAQATANDAVVNDNAEAVNGESTANLSVEELQSRLEQEQKQSKEYLDAFQRARADFLNLKRRTDQERTTISADARERMILRVLPIVDDFERALANVPENLKGEPWVNGVNMIEKKFKTLLEQENITELPALNTEFNPHLHDAVQRDEDAEGEKDWVTDVYQKGYKMGDKVICHAVVKVGRK